MKGQLFTPGQAITLEKPHTWETFSGPNKGRRGHGPKFGQVVHVDYYIWDDYLTLKEYPEKNSAGGVDCFNQNRFAPVVSSDHLAEELSEIFSEGIAVVK